VGTVKETISFTPRVVKPKSRAARAPSVALATAESPTHTVVMGLDKDLTKATKQAVREAIDFLVKDKGLSSDEAYMLTSVAVDFCITQLVDGTLGVHGMIPKRIFQKK